MCFFNQENSFPVIYNIYVARQFVVFSVCATSLDYIVVGTGWHIFAIMSSVPALRRIGK